ncbi:MAG: cytochrome C [Verrucomicrobia bacterium]|nr:MAG: cytochrome C [Verrucomicrobiota bacterium]
MSAESKKTFASADVSNAPDFQFVEGAEPTANRAPVPVWLIVFFGVLFYGGQIYLDHAAGGFNPQVYEPYADYATLKQFQPVIGDDLYARGEKVYNDVAKCVACHQPNGGGNTANGCPPLAGSEWVLAEGPNRIIRIVLHGFSGAVEVKGQQYNSGTMTPFADTLTDDKDIAAVLTFIRQNKDWGNNASAVKPEEVKKVRDATKGREVNWTASELQSIPPKD